MATFDSTNIQITYVTNANGSVYSYSGMPLSDSLPEASQVEVRFNSTIVYADNIQGVGTAVEVSSLAPEIQEAIIVLPGTLYSIDTDQNTVTVSPLGDTEIVIPGVTTAYYRPSVSDASATTPIVLRRSTDINSAVITFAPGARLTSGMLNASATQLLHASQELTAFSGGGSSGGGSAGDVDLSGSILSDIGNVDTPVGSGVLSYDELTQTYSVGVAGSLVPAGGNPGWVLAKDTAADGDTEWYDIQNELAAPLFSQIANLGSRVSDVESVTQKQDYSQPGGVPTTAFAGDLSTAPDPLQGGGNISATGDISATGEVSAASIDAGSGISFGDLEVGITARETLDGTGDILEVNVGGDSTGNGNISYYNGDDSRIGFYNASGYQYWWAPGEGEPDSDYGRYILIDPQSTNGTNAARIRLRNASDRFQDTIISNEAVTESLQFQSGRKINSRVDSDDLFTQWSKDGSNYTKIAGNNVTPRIAVVTNGATRMSVDNTGNLSANNFTPTSDELTKDYNVITPAPTSVAEKFKNLSTLDTYERIGLEGEILYGPTIQDLAAVGLTLAEGPNNPDGDRTMDLLSTVGLLMQAVKELTERIETLEGNN